MKLDFWLKLADCPPMPLAPPFTPEAAKLAGIKSGETRRRKRDEAKSIANSTPVQGQDEPRKRRVLKQIDITLDRLCSCNDDMLRVKLTGCLDTLWNLVWPKAGVLRPRSPKQPRSVPTASETPQAPVAIPARVDQKANVSTATPEADYPTI